MPLSPEAQSLAVIVAAVVVLWVTEALPLAVTALLGAVACVLAGVAPAQEVFAPFADPLVFLFIGSFILAEAIRLHGLDKRLAFAVLALPGVAERPGRVLAAVAAVCATASAFLSNTCVTAMMLAIVSGMITAIEEAGRKAGRPPAPGFATGLLLCVAFTASVGGLATPIGTPPNLIGLGFIRKQLGVDVSFPGWCLVGVPVAAVLTAFIVVVLGRMFPAGVPRLEGVRSFVAAERSRLGAWTVGQWSTAAAFAITVLLWVLPGVVAVTRGADDAWARLLKERLPEGVAALVGAVLLFVLPGGEAGGRRAALQWNEAKIDWGIVLLYGGGMALGTLCFSTGLAAAVGESIRGLVPAGPWGGLVLVALAATVAVFTSEFTSNTASANIVVPVAIALGTATGVEPLVAAFAATFAASLGFMMPVSTPCNALVYGTGRIPLKSMMAAGSILDLAGIAVITAATLLAAHFRAVAAVPASAPACVAVRSTAPAAAPRRPCEPGGASSQRGEGHFSRAGFLAVTAVPASAPAAAPRRPCEPGGASSQRGEGHFSRPSASPRLRGPGMASIAGRRQPGRKPGVAVEGDLGSASDRARLRGPGMAAKP